MNWESYLSKIEDYQLVSYGRIEGLGCDDKSEINIYQIVNEDEVLIKRLSYAKLILKNGDKWDFIKKYWKKNYRKFEEKYNAQ